MLGTFLTDVNLGIFTANLDRAKAIEATSEKVQIHHHRYEGIEFADFVRALLKAGLKKHADLAPVVGVADGTAKLKQGKGSDPVTVAHLFARLNDFLTDDMLVVCDVGDCLFGATDLVIHRRTEFLASAYYTSMGFAVPASLGAKVAAPKSRPLVLVGDGAFQMTGLELSTCARLGQNPIVIVLNNHGYTTERFILEGPFNDIAEWRFEKLPKLLGSGTGFVVKTLGELDEALKAALKNTKEFSILNVHLEKMDHSSALARLGKALADKCKPAAKA
jgi:indolepyruvate decarboxylase